MGKRVAVIGGGIIGVCTAEALLRDGHEVTLIEPGPFGGEQAASYGNGAFVSPASILPVSMPGLWRKVPGYLMDRSGPLTIRWPHAPRLAPWLLRFLAAGWTEGRVERTAAALAALLGEAPARHGALAARVGAGDLIATSGLLYLYPGRAAFEAEALAWRLRALHGVAFEEIGGADLAAAVPGLAPRYDFGVRLPAGRHCTDPGGYVAAIARHCMEQGARHVAARATGIDRTGSLTVRTDGGPVPCDAAVIACGMGAAPLARGCGDRVPLEAERGYHVEIPDLPLELPAPVMPQDLKVAIVRTRGGLRVAGQVELASQRAAPDWRRAESLTAKLRACFPDLPEQMPEPRRWQGNRPSTPDGLPVIGSSRTSGVFHAFGHGHVGLNAAPGTARLVADLVDGRRPPIDLSPFAPSRFA